jgi:adenylate kinase family enzyme
MAIENAQLFKDEITSEMKRVVIVGTSCSGKTTLASQFGDILHSKPVHLDFLYWLPNWQNRPDDEFRELISEITTQGNWIIDGNYSRVQDLIWPRATHLIWLNYSFLTVVGRAFRRTINRLLNQEELFAGNKTSFKHAFLSRASIIWWVITTYHRRKRRYRDALDGGYFPNLKIIELKSQVSTDHFRKQLREAASSTATSDEKRVRSGDRPDHS